MVCVCMCICAMVICACPWIILGFPGGTSGKKPACQCRRYKRGRFGPWVGNIPGGGNGNPLQYSCLENPMDRGAWWATVHGVKQSWTWLSDLAQTHLDYILAGRDMTPQWLAWWHMMAGMTSLVGNTQYLYFTLPVCLKICVAIVCITGSWFLNCALLRVLSSVMLSTFNSDFIFNYLKY